MFGLLKGNNGCACDWWAQARRPRADATEKENTHLYLMDLVSGARGGVGGGVGPGGRVGGWACECLLSITYITAGDKEARPSEERACIALQN